MDDDRIKAIVEWLADGARTAAAPQLVLLELCERMVEAGVPLWRTAAFVRTLHPQIMGRRFLWVPDAGVTVSEAPHDLLATPTYRDSPVARVCLSGQGLRRRLADPACPIDLNTLAELREEGVTDYVATPLIFTDGAVHAATWTTRTPGGFSDAHIAAIESVVAPLARVAEVRALRRLAGNLLDTYVGHQAGERILSGHIRRGDSEAIAAAIWLSDMRGFTMMADRLPPKTTIDLLNRYFDCQIPAIAERGGEVLKFMGDGLLAIFPIEGHDTDAVCRRALDAARQAREDIAGLDGWDNGTNGPRFGLALHLGEVLYGNIGGGERLDFTCIGPAVNMAARIERLAAALGRTVLASSRFARECQADMAGVGDFVLPGISETQAIYGLAEEASRS
ncbi:adenylate/guanylate cyclase domain-containing protein [Vineibacter terrae]|uniref:adenylate/guanylate cyclase domain-containing protein n=1 Tax=Vineibacter terrae TaxID=2586908 RepID=UPI002E30AD80|nr:adenylate/guanylate cyclase domain-containing protein [Vineibacter terrae]HEX2887553.1 adenylate/guanylate cyclase domain-containing protein [Vineibacter terrae]